MAATCPFTSTQPWAIHSSASRREHRPSSARRLFRRMPSRGARDGAGAAGTARDGAGAGDAARGAAARGASARGAAARGAAARGALVAPAGAGLRGSKRSGGRPVGRGSDRGSDRVAGWAAAGALAAAAGCTGRSGRRASLKGRARAGPGGRTGGRRGARGSAGGFGAAGFSLRVRWGGSWDMGGLSFPGSGLCRRARAPAKRDQSSMPDRNDCKSSTRKPPYSMRIHPLSCSVRSASLTRCRDRPTR